MDKELQQVLPGLSRNQIQVLMRKLATNLRFAQHGLIQENF